jgi:hypothetical protein
VEEQKKRAGTTKRIASEKWPRTSLHREITSYFYLILTIVIVFKARALQDTPCVTTILFCLNYMHMLLQHDMIGLRNANIQKKIENKNQRPGKGTIITNALKHGQKSLLHYASICNKLYEDYRHAKNGISNVRHLYLT